MGVVDTTRVRKRAMRSEPRMWRGFRRERPEVASSTAAVLPYGEHCRPKIGPRSS